MILVLAYLAIPVRRVLEAPRNCKSVIVFGGVIWTEIGFGDEYCRIYLTSSKCIIIVA